MLLILVNFAIRHQIRRGKIKLAIVKIRKNEPRALLVFSKNLELDSSFIEKRLAFHQISHGTFFCQKLQQAFYLDSNIHSKKLLKKLKPFEKGAYIHTKYNPQTYTLQRKKPLHLFYPLLPVKLL